MSQSVLVFSKLWLLALFGPAWSSQKPTTGPAPAGATPPTTCSLPPVDVGQKIFEFLNGKECGIHEDFLRNLDSLTLSHDAFLSPDQRKRKIQEFQVARARTTAPVPLQLRVLDALFSKTVFAPQLPWELLQPSWEKTIFGAVRDVAPGELSQTKFPFSNAFSNNPPIFPTCHQKVASHTVWHTVGRTTVWHTVVRPSISVSPSIESALPDEKEKIEDGQRIARQEGDAAAYWHFTGEEWPTRIEYSVAVEFPEWSYAPGSAPLFVEVQRLLLTRPRQESSVGAPGASVAEEELSGRGSTTASTGTPTGVSARRSAGGGGGPTNADDMATSSSPPTPVVPFQWEWSIQPQYGSQDPCRNLDRVRGVSIKLHVDYELAEYVEDENVWLARLRAEVVVKCREVGVGNSTGERATKFLGAETEFMLLAD